MTADEYDFVIVGGGTSGLLIAARLSEDPNLQVLVVEAGANMIEDSRVKTPALFQALKTTDADWGFTTQAQATLKGREINLSQGRALGGSSAINAHVFVPPSKTVIDSWEKLGNPGWNWNVLRPYYAKVIHSNRCNPNLGSTLVFTGQTKIVVRHQARFKLRIPAIREIHSRKLGSKRSRIRATI